VAALLPIDDTTVFTVDFAVDLILSAVGLRFAAATRDFSSDFLLCSSFRTSKALARASLTSFSRRNFSACSSASSLLGRNRRLAASAIRCPKDLATLTYLQRLFSPTDTDPAFSLDRFIAASTDIFRHLRRLE